MTTELEIKGMTCQNCVKHVKNALENVEGVESVEVTLEPGLAKVQHTPQVATADLVDAVDEEGYEAKLKADA
jgi:copper chaperone CopZ